MSLIPSFIQKQMVLRRADLGYLVAVSLSGALLISWGTLQVLQADLQWLIFLLLLLLTVVASFTTSTLKVEKSSITYSVESITSFAAIPVLGMGAAILINVVGTVSTWLAKPRHEVVWKKSWRQLAFNMSMQAIATVVTAMVLRRIQTWLGSGYIHTQILSWVVASIFYDQINLWLLIGMLHLQKGNKVHPLLMWREEWWASKIFIVIYAVGGGLLAYAIEHFDWLGITIFFLPVLLSAYAFRLYVERIGIYMANLEEIVAERTSELRKRIVELQEVNQQKESPFYALSADMTTALTNIYQYAEMLRSSPTSSGEDRHLAELIQDNQATLRQKVNNLAKVLR